MTLAPEEIKELKSQLRAQVQHLPEQQKQAALAQIDSLSSEALESMIKQQKSSSNPKSQNQSDKLQKGVFRMIIDSEIPAKKIDENKDAIAVLDIKPVSKGHIVIIPKKSITNVKSMPNSILTLAKKVAKTLETKLKAKSSEIQTEFKFGEIVINVIPIYNEPLNINSPRKDSSPEELESLYNQLRTKPKQKIERVIIKKPRESSVLKIKRRIA